MITAILLTFALGQYTPEVFPYGIESQAGHMLGSGAPDFQCGWDDPSDTNDAGTAFNSKYCYLQLHILDNYRGYHGDLTITSGPRTAGWLLHINTTYPVFTVAYNGDIWTWGSIEVSQNGGGIRNAISYLGLYGNSTDSRVVADVVLVPKTTHFIKGWLFQIWNGGPQFGFRDDGAVKLGNSILKVTNTAEAASFTFDMADGGTRTLTLPFDP